MCSNENRCARKQYAWELPIVTPSVNQSFSSPGGDLCSPRLVGFFTSSPALLLIPVPDPSLFSSLKPKLPPRLPYHLLPIESIPLHRVTSALQWYSWATPASLPFPPALLHASPEPLHAVWPSLSTGNINLKPRHSLPSPDAPAWPELSLCWDTHSPWGTQTLARRGVSAQGRDCRGSTSRFPGESEGHTAEGLRVTAPGKGSSRWYVYLSTPPSRFTIKFWLVRK